MRSNSNTKHNKVTLVGILFIVQIFVFFAAFLLLFVGTNVKTEKVTVVEINGQSVMVQLGDNYGDPIIYEMKKPLFFNLEEGDKIYVRYGLDTSNTGQLHYFIKPDILTRVGSLLIVSYFLIVVIIIIFLFASLSKLSTEKS